MTDDDPFIGALEAARLFGVTPHTLRNWVAGDLLKGKVRTRTMPGGTVRYARNDIHDYLKENTK